MGLAYQLVWRISDQSVFGWSHICMSLRCESICFDAFSLSVSDVFQIGSDLTGLSICLFGCFHYIICAAVHISSFYCHIFISRWVLNPNSISFQIRCLDDLRRGQWEVRGRLLHLISCWFLFKYSSVPRMTVTPPLSACIYISGI